MTSVRITGRPYHRHAGALVPLLADLEAPPAPVYALTPPGRYPTRAVRALTDHLAAALALPPARQK